MDETRDLDITEEKQASEEAPPAEAAETVEGPAAERDRLAEDRNALLDQLQRKQAEFENFRKRTERERRDVLQYAAMDVLREVLPVLDALERALDTYAGSGDEFHTGIELIARQLWDTLARFGLTPIRAKGLKFDPHLHQAVETVETDEYEDQTVLEEWQRGYMFKNKLLRPAMVKVAVGPKSE